MADTGSVGLIPVGMLNGFMEGREQLLVEAGQSIREVIMSLGVRPWLVCVMMVNGVRVEKGYVLQPGDRLKLLLLISGS